MGSFGVLLRRDIYSFGYPFWVVILDLCFAGRQVPRRIGAATPALNAGCRWLVLKARMSLL
ncbi:hypothetical protein DSUL_140105 [Desulfovibrionales bacterium]